MGAPSTAFVKQYQDTIALLAQQMDSRLRGAVMVDTDWTGEEKYYDQYYADEMVEIVGRLTDTPIQNPDHRRRRVTPRYFVSNTLEDPFEALAMLVDPKSAYMQAKQAAANRKVDSLVITAMGGNAYTGKAGGTTQALGAGQKIAVAASGLTKTKLIGAVKLLDAAEVDVEDRHIVVTAEQKEDLLNTTEVTSADYNTVKALVEGTINSWLGFKFHHSEQLETDGTNRLVYAWQKKGVQLAIQKEPEGRVTERADKNYAWQVYLKLALGATRLEEVRVVEIACAE